MYFSNLKLFRFWQPVIGWKSAIYHAKLRESFYVKSGSQRWSETYVLMASVSDVCGHLSECTTFYLPRTEWYTICTVKLLGITKTFLVALLKNGHWINEKLKFVMLGYQVSSDFRKSHKSVSIQSKKKWNTLWINENVHGKCRRPNIRLISFPPFFLREGIKGRERGFDDGETHRKGKYPDYERLLLRKLHAIDATLRQNYK